MKHILLTLQQIAWTSKLGVTGLTWAYSNRKTKPTNFFGDKSTGFKVSRYTPGATTDASTEIVTMFLSHWDNELKQYVDVTDEEVELYRAEYGSTCYVDEDNNLITLAEYAELMSQGEDVEEGSDSEQPFAE